MPFTFKHNDRPLDDFTIQRAVGAGGFGEVYYAMSDGGREVALKYLKSNPHVELRGVSHCINLKSPHLVSIFDVKKNADGEYFIVMEYCSGPSLRDLLIAEPNGFKPEKAAFFVREIAKGLAYLHDRGIVHRDLKPGNIFYDDGYVKIGDYGLSKFIAVSRHSAQTASVGTVHYMAPEIGSGNYSRGVDIYALGVMLYEMLLGKVPFEGSSMAEVLMKHLTNQPEVDELPQPFGKIIRKALEKDPKDRYQSVDEMVEDLLAVDAVKESLAGFSPQSLSGAVARGGAAIAESPVPSPNPYTPRGTVAPLPATTDLPADMAKRVDRISRKLDKRIAKLGGPTPPTDPPQQRENRRHSDKWEVPAVPDLSIEDRRKRFVLFALASLGIMGGGSAVGSMMGEEAAASGFFLVGAMAGAVMLARRILAWLGPQAKPWWARRLVQALCAGLLINMGAIPLYDSYWHSQAGIAMAIGLIFVTIFGGWRKHMIRGARGEAGLGAAICTGIYALLITLMMCGPTDVDPLFSVLGGAIALGAALLVQGWSWALPTTGKWAIDPCGPPPQPDAHAVAMSETARPQAAGDTSDTASPRPTVAASPWAQRTDTEDGSGHAQRLDVGPQRPERWLPVRVFWAFVAFLFMACSLVSLLLVTMSDRMSDQQQVHAIFACVGFFCVMLFAIRRTGPFRQIGFWRETLRPLLLCSALAGVGGSITALCTDTRIVPAGNADESAALAITGIVVFSMMFFVFLALRGREREVCHREDRPKRRSGLGLAAGLLFLLFLLAMLAALLVSFSVSRERVRARLAEERQSAAAVADQGYTTMSSMIEVDIEADKLAEEPQPHWKTRAMTDEELEAAGSTGENADEYFVAEDFFDAGKPRISQSYKKLASGSWVLQGRVTSYWPGRVKRAEENYNDNLRHGPFRRWNRHGSVAVVGQFKNGKEHGKWRTYYPNGFTQHEFQMVDGALNGVHTYYFDNGAKAAEARYVGGAIEGTMLQWDEYGRLKSKTVFNRGE